jgi:hypothetical protein
VNRLIAFIKKLRLRQVLAIFFVSILLIANTACSGANAQGANPNNPAVQAGGANNPYKGGGDKYLNQRMSVDAEVNNHKGDQSTLLLNSQPLVAYSNRESEILYPGAETPEGRIYKEDNLPIVTQKSFEQPEPGGLIQNSPDVGTRFRERINAVQGAFGEASEFLKDKSAEASARPELKRNPALEK